MDLLINLTNGANNAASPWANVINDSTTVVVIPAPDGSDSGWTVANDGTADAGLPGGTDLGQFPTSSDASWVSDTAAEFAYTLSAWTEFFYKLLLTGPANTNFVLEVFSSSDRDENPKWKVNGSTVQTLSELNNTTNVLTFSATTDGNGDAFVEVAKGGGFCRANAMRIILPDSASVTTTDTLQPGTEFTLTATNFAAPPVSPVTLIPLDTNGDVITGITPITVAVTITGSGPYTATGTMPTLAEAVTAGNSIPFGSTRISLST